jgi:hypothetical protein
MRWPSRSIVGSAGVCAGVGSSADAIGMSEPIAAVSIVQMTEINSNRLRMVAPNRHLI